MTWREFLFLRDKDIETFYELEYFTGLLEIPIHCFKDCSSPWEQVKIPPTTVTTLKSEAKKFFP